MIAIVMVVVVGLVAIVLAVGTPLMRGRDGRAPAAGRDADAPDPLERELAALLDQGVLSSDQADRVRDAAAESASSAGAAELRRAHPQRAGVLDVLGYLGGALVLGALIFVGFTLWGDLSRSGKIGLAVASFVVPTLGGAVLVLSRTRRGLAEVLLTIGCFAAGFAYFEIARDEDLMVTAAVVVATAAGGAVALRSALFYVPAWIGAMALVPLFVENVWQPTDEDVVAYVIAAGFLVVGVLFVVAGLGLARHAAWTFAGVSGWAAGVPLLAIEHSYVALAVATVVAAALLIGVVRYQMYAFAVVGCLVVLSMWPVALYQLLDTALGVALGLVAAGCALISAAVLLARRRRHAPSASLSVGPNPQRQPIAPPRDR